MLRQATRLWRWQNYEAYMRWFQISDAMPRGSFKYFYADKLNCKPGPRARRHEPTGKWIFSKKSQNRRTCFTYTPRSTSKGRGGDRFGLVPGLIINTSKRRWVLGAGCWDLGVGGVAQPGLSWEHLRLKMMLPRLLLCHHLSLAACHATCQANKNWHFY